SKPPSGRGVQLELAQVHPFAPAPFGANDGNQIQEGPVDVVVDDHVLIRSDPTLDLRAGSEQAAPQGLLSLGAPLPQAALQLLERGWNDEDAGCLRVLLLHRVTALNVDVEDRQATGSLHAVDDLLRTSVEVPMYLRPLDELA